MDRDWLEAQLAAGRSIESIAREVGKHPSTVGYWVNKHGLASLHAARHAATRRAARERRCGLVEEGLSIRQIAERLDVSATTVRHWLRRYELKTARARDAVATDPTVRERSSARVPPARSRRTLGARRHERALPLQALQQRGGDRTGGARSRRSWSRRPAAAASLCGYDRFPGALQFHHVDPAQKSFALSVQGVARSLERHEQRPRNACSCARTVTPK